VKVDFPVAIRPVILMIRLGLGGMVHLLGHMPANSITAGAEGYESYPRNIDGRLLHHTPILGISNYQVATSSKLFDQSRNLSLKHRARNGA
jgi:hypothetical protein